MRGSVLATCLALAAASACGSSTSSTINPNGRPDPAPASTDTPPPGSDTAPSTYDNPPSSTDTPPPSTDPAGSCAPCSGTYDCSAAGGTVGGGDAGSLSITLKVVNGVCNVVADGQSVPIGSLCGTAQASADGTTVTFTVAGGNMTVCASTSAQGTAAASGQECATCKLVGSASSTGSSGTGTGPSGGACSQASQCCSTLPSDEQMGCNNAFAAAAGNETACASLVTTLGC